MESLKEAAKRAGNQFSARALTNSKPPPSCLTCNDTGTEITEKGARLCTCRLTTPEAKRLRILDLMPARYRDVALSTLEPRNDLHRDQGKVIEFMKTHPEVNYYFCGENDCGKTHFFWALYEHAVARGQKVFATTMYDFIQACKAEFANDYSFWRRHAFTIQMLQQSESRYGIFIDDVDKARPTEYAAETFFNLVDTIYTYGHQLVVTSQLDPTEKVNGRNSLVEHFEKADERYAVGIVRRIVNDETAIFRMF